MSHPLVAVDLFVVAVIRSAAVVILDGAIGGVAAVLFGAAVYLAAALLMEAAVPFCLFCALVRCRASL